MPKPPEPTKSSVELFPVIYDELRRLAAAYMRRERPGHTLQPTALVHEAYLRVARETAIGWAGKTHFVAIAAIQMRRVLVDHARKRNAQKNGGGWERITLDDAVAVGSDRTVDIIALDAALQNLRQLDARQSTVVELRLFGGLSDAELAEYLGVSERTIREDWRAAKAWLAQALRRKL
jgi:RNA polymerase sigma factor (TIGR02999 family)